MICTFIANILRFHYAIGEFHRNWEAYDEKQDVYSTAYRRPVRDQRLSGPCKRRARFAIRFFRLAVPAGRRMRRYRDPIRFADCGAYGSAADRSRRFEAEPVRRAYGGTADDSRSPRVLRKAHRRAYDGTLFAADSNAFAEACGKPFRSAGRNFNSRADFLRFYDASRTADRRPYRYQSAGRNEKTCDFNACAFHRG